MSQVQRSPPSEEAPRAAGASQAAVTTKATGSTKASGTPTQAIRSATADATTSAVKRLELTQQSTQREIEQVSVAVRQAKTDNESQFAAINNQLQQIMATIVGAIPSANTTTTSNNATTGSRSSNICTATTATTSNNAPTATTATTNNNAETARAATANGEDDDDEPSDTEQGGTETRSEYSVSHQIARKLHDLPTFSGQPEEWSNFAAIFEQSTAAYSYTNLDNNIRFRRCLTGSAKEEVESLLLDSNDTPLIMKALERRFGRPDLLVQAHLRRVQIIAPIPENRPELLVPYAAKVANVVAAIDKPKTRRFLLNPSLLEELVQKLPLTRRNEWGNHAAKIEPYPTVRDFRKWLDEAARGVTFSAPAATLAATNELPLANKPKTGGSHQQSAKPRERMYHAVDRATCGVCRGTGHSEPNCRQFERANISGRWNIVRSENLCISCLQRGHVSKFCTARKHCNIGGCLRPHHHMLHTNPFDGRQQNAQAETSSQRATALQVNAAQAPNEAGASTSQQADTVVEDRERLHLGHATIGDLPRTLFRVLPVQLTGPAGTIKTYALYDEGSSVSMIERALADELRLDGPESRLDLQWFGSRHASEVSRTVTLQISGIGIEARRFKLTGVRTMQNLNLPRQSVDMAIICDWYKQMRGLPIESYDGAVPKLLIGVDNAYLGVALRHVCGLTAGPLAAKTRLGWTICGPLREATITTRVAERVMTIIPNWLTELHQAVKDHFSLDSVGIYRPADALESRQDRRARDIMEATTRQVGQRFETGLLWRRDSEQLPDSKPMATNRLQSLERKMSRDPDYARRYHAIIEGLVTNGYARKLTTAEAAVSDDHLWYLPHFAILNPNKPGKMRVVFDAAACVGNVSLNTALLKGPDNNRSLVEVLHNFRFGAIGVCADIKEMFLRVRIRKEDVCAQRFLWRERTDQPIDIYVMESMIFGAACSPSSAQFVKNLNADVNGGGQSEAIRLVKEAHYVDDFVASFGSAEDAIQTTRAVVEIHRRGGFELRGFVSNDPNVVRAIDSGDATGEATLDMQLDASAADKILGMYWCTLEDAFMFRLDFNRVDKAVIDGSRIATKREMLSAVMAIYDPFGFLANFTIYGKLLLQDIWRHGSQWDDPVPDDVHTRWCQWVAKFEVCRAVRVPRCYGANITSRPAQLHIFADSSQSAMAAVAYWRMECGPNEWQISFVIGKSRVAPPKLISVPRLELQAAILAVRLNRHVRKTHHIDIERTIYWTDSKTVVQWIRSDRSQFPPFVAHRIAEIWEDTAIADWRWVPTHLNSADDATRAVYPVRYAATNRWIDGSDFLRLPEDQWPEEEPATRPCEDGTEQGPLCSVHLVCTAEKLPVVRLTAFCDYYRMCRSMAYAIRFTTNCRMAERVGGVPTAIEIDKAERLLVRAVQEESFSEELARLRRGDSVQKGSALWKLMPIIGQDGIMRVNGRIDRAEFLAEDARRPMILPQSHHFTNVVVAWYHRRMRHQQQAAVVGEIRTKFWVPHLRTIVKRIKSACMFCRLRAAIPTEPVLGQLPIDRVTPYVRVFTYTGVDYFGPMSVTVGRRREQRYGALFTCMTVRAVHLELAADLSTDSFILCLRNFINIRGTPKVMRSDNGTNFVGAARELREAIDLLDHDAIQTELGVNRIQWLFNCPRHPQAGGCWERLVQSVKRVLRVTVKEVAPKVETLRSLLIEAANIVNSRPLTHVPVTCDEDEPLTPNHLLLGCSSSTQTPGPDDDKLLCMRKQYRVAQTLKNRFWKRWLLEYLPDLTRRAKGYDEQPQINVGALVLMVDTQLPRGQWRRGRVTEVFPGVDGRIRYALVKTAKDEYKRPVSKLAVLDVLGES